MRRFIAPLVWIVTLAAAAALAWRDRALPAGDLLYFADAGRTLLSGSWLHVYHASGVQAGPLELAFVGGIARLLGSSWTSVALGVDLAGAVAVLAVARVVVGPRPGRLALVALAALAIGIVSDPFASGHPAELAIAVSWLLAAREAKVGRAYRAGFLVGVSAGWELWGALGIVVLVLAPRLRDAIRGGALAATVGAAFLAPFWLGGDFHMFEYAWLTTSGTTPALLIGAGQPFAWPLRVLQGAAVVGAGGIAALLLRRRPESVWAVPVVVGLAKITLDPLRYDYYWDTPLLLLLAGAAATLPALWQKRGIRVDRVPLLGLRRGHRGAEVDQGDDSLVVG